MQDSALRAELDIEIVGRMARGDNSALGALYDRHASALLATSHRILNNRAAAEDIVHDVFLEAWRHAADFNPARGSVRTWLVLRTRSRALDHRKSAQVRRTESPSDTLLLNDLAGTIVSDPFESPDRNRVIHLLRQLPQEQREVLVLGYFEGMSSSEMAEYLHVPIGTVKSRVAAALQGLRRTLGTQSEEKQ